MAMASLAPEEPLAEMNAAADSIASPLPAKSPIEEFSSGNFELETPQKRCCLGLRAGASSFVCEWIPTSIRLELPRFADSTGLAPQGECFLCLPFRCSVRQQWLNSRNNQEQNSTAFPAGGEVPHQGEEKEECLDSSFASSAEAQLRLMALDRYLATIPPLAMSTKHLLHTNDGPESIGIIPGSKIYGNPLCNITSKGYRRKQRQKSKQMSSSSLPIRPDNRHYLLTPSNAGRILNVIQGEIAHCTPHQADVLVSDDATTCHIMALWSHYECADDACPCHRDEKKDIPDSQPSSNVLATLAHIDGPGYESCIRDAVMEHVRHHSCRWNKCRWQHQLDSNDAQFDNGLNNECSTNEDLVEECKESCTSCKKSGSIKMTIHLMGGFNDERRSSIEITDDILRTFSELSKEFDEYLSYNNNNNTNHDQAQISKDKHYVQNKDGNRGQDLHGILPPISMTLKTCAVASSNDDGARSPLGRGLAMTVATGRVFLAELEEEESSRIYPSSRVSKPPHSAVTSHDGVDLVAVDGDIHLVKSCKFPGGVSYTSYKKGRYFNGEQINNATSAEGPEIVLRSMRLWAAAFYPCDNSNDNQEEYQHRKLTVIHRPDDEHLYIDPFMFGPHSYAKDLLKLDDADLLRFTSTSPDVEKPNFCQKVRQSLTLMNGTDSSRIFIKMDGVYQPMKYKRAGLNDWILGS